MRLATAILLGAVLLTAAQPALKAKTYLVPTEHEDLAWALREASYGDTILVLPGKYKLQTKLRSGVKLLSAEGPDSTILWNWRWHIVKMVDCDIETEVSGFTFEGKGSNTCLACTTGAPIIRDNIIKDSWDGISLYRCNAFIKGNTITGCNRAIHVDMSDAELVENKIIRNGDGISMVSASPLIARCRLESNGKAILIMGHSYPTIGGMLSTANDILGNSYGVYNAGLQAEGTQFTDQPEIAVATHNYWGSDCPSHRRFMGEVVYRPWTNAAHDTLFDECPELKDAGEDKPR